MCAIICCSVNTIARKASSSIYHRCVSGWVVGCVSGGVSGYTGEKGHRMCQWVNQKFVIGCASGYKRGYVIRYVRGYKEGKAEGISHRNKRRRVCVCVWGGGGGVWWLPSVPSLSRTF